MKYIAIWEIRGGFGLIWIELAVLDRSVVYEMSLLHVIPHDLFCFLYLRHSFQGIIYYNCCLPACVCCN